VYSKFRSLGYPTDPVGRTKLLDARLPHSSNSQAGDLSHGIVFNELANNQSPNHYVNELSPVPEALILERPTKTWKHGAEVSSPASGQAFQYATNLDRQLGKDQLEGEGLRQDRMIHSAGFHTSEPDVHPGTPWCPPNNTTICEDWDFDQAFEFRNWPVKLNGIAYFDQNSAPFNPEALHSRNPQEFSLSIGLQLDAGPSLTASPPLNNPNHESTFFNHQDNGQFLPKHGSNHLVESLDTPSTARSSNSIRKIRSLFRAKSGDSRATRRYADSQFTTETRDSGYVSGFTSCISFGDVSNINPRSLEEFNGLYRVACGTLHEPHSKAQWKDIPTCNYCRYSSIHNLGWSARYLKLEVFSLELELSGIYDPGALDAAGNTALHYAAASGAGFKHLKALIDAGVNPYAANTAGELFIYCLRPLQPFTLEPNSDCFDGDDLIHLLELLQPQLAFDWRDNDGQTIMHALALKMTDRELKAKIFK